MKFIAVDSFYSSEMKQVAARTVFDPADFDLSEPKVAEMVKRGLIEKVKREPEPAPPPPAPSLDPDDDVDGEPEHKAEPAPLNKALIGAPKNKGGRPRKS